MTVYFARKEYVYSGGDAIFSIPFSYIKKEHISVHVNDEATENYTYLNNSQIQVNDTLKTNDVVSIIRSTPIDSRMVVFSDTSILDKKAQNLAQEQVFDAIQEVYDNNIKFNIDTLDILEANKEELEQTIANNKQELLNIQSSFESEVTQTIANNKQELEGEIQNFENGVNTTIAQNKADTDKQIADFEQEVNTTIDTVKEAAEKVNSLEQAVGEAKAAAQTATTKSDETQEVLANAITEMDSKLTTAESSMDSRLSSATATMNEKLSAANTAVENAMQQANLATQKAQEIIDINPANTNLSNLTEDGIKVIKGTSGSSLEVCDIGMALYVDETKGLRRYLNGQIVDVNTNTQAFLNRLKEITTLHPSLLCTEDEWQTAKTMSAFGQVGKFVFNYSGENIVSVRLPRVVNVQGLFDLQNLGMTVDESLPNITGRIAGQGNRTAFQAASGAFYKSGEISGSGAADKYDDSCRIAVEFNASRSSSTYQDGAPVQQEAIQFPYFIQIATGSETENNITNEIELNNPSFFGDSKYVPTKVNNLSWLKSEGQNNPKGTYPSFYDWILENVNKGEKGFKLSTDTDITDYDFVINTTDETFRLPLLNGSENKLGKFEPIPLPAFGSDFSSPYVNGMYEIFANRSTNDGYLYIVNKTTDFECDNNTLTDGWGRVHCPASLGDVIVIATSIPEGGQRFARYAKYIGNGSLYYYVGETVQNAKLIDAGRIGEILPTKLDASKVKAYIVETYRNGSSWYRIYSDGWCEQGGLKTGGSSYGVTTVYLLKPFINKAYWVNASRTGLESSWFTGSSGVLQSGATDLTGIIETRLSDRFTMQSLGDHLWYACGYIR